MTAIVKIVYLRRQLWPLKMKIEELELQLESKVCGLGVDGLVELAEKLEVEAKELRKLALSKKSLRTCKTTKQENSWSLH